MERKKCCGESVLYEELWDQCCQGIDFRGEYYDQY
jgi:hypothetical protein